MNAIEHAQRTARHYRSLGFNALPSRMDVKGPDLPSYAEFWETPLPDHVYDDWRTTNIQLMTGTYWRLVVVDCDGDEAHTVWRQMKRHHGMTWPTPTWVARTGGGGWHYYFTLPTWIDECPSRRLWGVWDTWAGTGKNPGSVMKGDWKKHQEVRLLGDRSLAIAPPSIHVKTGQPYEFLPGRDPEAYPLPMACPAWLLAMPAIVNPITVEPRQPPRIAMPRKAPGGPVEGHYDRQPVLDAITDKAALARSWGLRFGSQGATASGWIAVHAIDRDDRTPSASFHPDLGIYSEKREGIKLGFFDLAVALNQYADWRAACNDLGARYCPSASPGRR